METRTHTSSDSEDYKEFLEKTLANQPEALQQLATFIMEIVVSELKKQTYSLTITLSPKLITFTLNHSGKAFNDSIVTILSDLIDDLKYNHLARDRHELIMYKEKE